MPDHEPSSRLRSPLKVFSMESMPVRLLNVSYAYACCDCCAPIIAMLTRLPALESGSLTSSKGSSQYFSKLVAATVPEVAVCAVMHCAPPKQFGSAYCTDVD